METGSFKKISAPAADIAARFALSPEAGALLAPGDGAAAFVAKLRQAGLLADAVNFLAHGLPKREATWLVCLAARASLPAEPDPIEIGALEAAERWVFKPGEETRVAAAAEAKAPNRETTPPQLAASAAAWSGGSMAPPGEPTVPPGETLTAVAVYTGVITAAFRSAPEQGQEMLNRFLDQAVDIADGGTGRLDKPQPAQPA
jgi:hypothetical protein